MLYYMCAWPLGACCSQITDNGKLMYRGRIGHFSPSSAMGTAYTRQQRMIITDIFRTASPGRHEQTNKQIYNELFYGSDRRPFFAGKGTNILKEKWFSSKLIPHTTIAHH